MSMTRGDVVAERAGIRDAAQRAAERYERLQAELAALKPASSKERDMDAYLTRRASLQTELRQADSDRQSVPAITVADPGAVALATYAGALGLKTDAATLGLSLPLVGVLALEFGAAFSIMLVRGTMPWDTQTPANKGNVVSQLHTVPMSQDAAIDVSRGTSARRQKAKRRDREPPSSGTRWHRRQARLGGPLRTPT
jgi:hypothetical protein